MTASEAKAFVGDVAYSVNTLEDDKLYLEPPPEHTVRMKNSGTSESLTLKVRAPVSAPPKTKPSFIFHSFFLIIIVCLFATCKNECKIKVLQCWLVAVYFLIAFETGFCWIRFLPQIKFGNGEWEVGSVVYEGKYGVPLAIIIPAVIIPMLLIIATSAYCYR